MNTILIIILCLLSFAVSSLTLFLVSFMIQEIRDNRKTNRTYYINSVLESPGCYSIVPIIMKRKNCDRLYFQDSTDDINISEYDF